MDHPVVMAVIMVGHHHQVTMTIRVIIVEVDIHHVRIMAIVHHHHNIINITNTINSTIVAVGHHVVVVTKTGLTAVAAAIAVVEDEEDIELIEYTYCCHFTSHTNHVYIATSNFRHLLFQNDFTDGQATGLQFSTRFKPECRWASLHHQVSCQTSICLSDSDCYVYGAVWQL